MVWLKKCGLSLLVEKFNSSIVRCVRMLQRFSIRWNIITAVGEPADNVLERHGSKSIRDRLV